MLLCYIAEEHAAKPWWDVSLKTAQVLIVRSTASRVVPFQDQNSGTSLNKAQQRIVLHHVGKISKNKSVLVIK